MTILEPNLLFEWWQLNPRVKENKRRTINLEGRIQQRTHVVLPKKAQLPSLKHQNITYKSLEFLVGHRFEPGPVCSTPGWSDSRDWLHSTPKKTEVQILKPPLQNKSKANAKACSKPPLQTGEEKKNRAPSRNEGPSWTGRSRCWPPPQTSLVSDGDLPAASFLVQKWQGLKNRNPGKWKHGLNLWSHDGLILTHTQMSECWQALRLAPCALRLARGKKRDDIIKKRLETSSDWGKHP